MALISNYKNDLVIALHDKIVTMSLKSGESSSFIISMDHTFSGTKIESDGEEPDKSDQNKIEVIDVNNIAISEDLLAVTTTEKSLFLFNLATGTDNFVSRRRINRIATALKFSPDGGDAIVTDRTGDVYIFSCTNQDNGKWLYGHMSQTLDISFSADQKFVFWFHV
jgi:WD40 repeat protein